MLKKVSCVVDCRRKCWNEVGCVESKAVLFGSRLHSNWGQQCQGSTSLVLELSNCFPIWKRAWNVYICNIEFVAKRPLLTSRPIYKAWDSCYAWILES